MPAVPARSSSQFRKKARHHIVNVDQLDFVARIGDRDGQAVGDVVAEGGHDGVVVGAAPFAEDVGQPEDPHRSAGLRAKVRRASSAFSLLRP